MTYGLELAFWSWGWGKPWGFGKKGAVSPGHRGMAFGGGLIDDERRGSGGAAGDAELEAGGWVGLVAGVRDIMGFGGCGHRQ